jgi:Predicted membrane protein
MFCKKCGQQLASEQAAVCEKCGAPNALANSAVTNGGRKSRLIAGLLAIFLGVFGAHNFYLGFRKKALIQLLLTLFAFGVGTLFVFVYALIEGIKIFTGAIKFDAKGEALAGENTSIAVKIAAIVLAVSFAAFLVETFGVCGNDNIESEYQGAKSAAQGHAMTKSVSGNAKTLYKEGAAAAIEAAEHSLRAAKAIGDIRTISFAENALKAIKIAAKNENNAAAREEAINAAHAAQSVAANDDSCGAWLYKAEKIARDAQLLNKNKAFIDACESNGYIRRAALYAKSASANATGAARDAFYVSGADIVDASHEFILGAQKNAKEAKEAADNVIKELKEAAKLLNL